MKQIAKKLVALVLCLVMLASSAGCQYALLGCAVASCASSCAPDDVKQSVTDTIVENVVEGLTETVPELVPLITDPVESPKSDEPTAEPTTEPAANNPGADETFLALDRELFVWYVSSDITTLDQYCYDPAAFGIDESTVPVTLGDYSEEADAEWTAACKEWLERLRKIDRSALNEQNQFACDNYVRYFETQIAYEELFYYNEPYEEIVGLQVNLPLVFSLYDFKDATDVENYLTLLADVPRYMAQTLVVEQKRAELGIFMTEVMLDSVLEDFDNVIAHRDDCYLMATFREALENVDWLTAEQKEAYYARNDELVRGAFIDGYVLVRDGLEALRPYCRRMTGAKNMGDDALRYYELELKHESASSMSVNEAITFLKDVSEDLYYALMAAYRKAKSDESHFTTGTLEGDERYLKTLITSIVPPMPEISVTYKEIPKELQDGFSPAAYLLPSFDNYMQNTILINPADKTDLLTLAHEGYPGHMFQYTYQLSLGTIPLFQMLIEPIGYAEAWSTNAEYSVAKRADMFDAASVTMTKLNEELTNAIITVAGLMVNGKGASKDQMVDYLADWGLEEYADDIWELVVNLPTYYFKYTMGFCQQYSLTERCRKLYNFQDRDFYEEYLSWGPSYFDLLEPKLIAWAKKNASK